MAADKDHDDEQRGIERAERDPVGFEADWLRATSDKPGATSDKSGEQTWDSAMAVVSGEEPDRAGDTDDPVANGYKGDDRRMETPRAQEGDAELPAPPRPGY